MIVILTHGFFFDFKEYFNIESQKIIWTTKQDKPNRKYAKSYSITYKILKTTN